MANDYTIQYYSAPNVVDQIPESFRIYDRRTAMLTKISEGRANLMRLLLNYAKANGAYVAHDVETRWGLEYGRLARIYCASDSTSTSGSLNDLIYVTNAEGRRLQAGDILNLMGFWVSPSRGLASADGQYLNVKSSSYPVPEQIKVEINYGDDSGSTGVTKIKVRRNFGGVQPTGHSDMLVDISGGTWSDPITEPFLWKAGNSVAEGIDDQITYSDVDTYDYNYTQLVMRKWSATDVEQNVDRFFSNEKTFQRNGRRALEEFFKELDVMALFGSRRTETENGLRKWYAGGIAEFIPAANHIHYDDSMFQTKNFNTQLKDMFYYGNQTKIVLCGADFYTQFSNMIDNKIILPAATNSWGVELTRFSGTNGGTLLFAPSDTLSLHGMADFAYVIDPASFQYGHLQNMDINTIQGVQVNPHKQEAEIFGSVTFKRTNPYAHWVFLKASA
jgi:Family of unknown function (DUF5309)